MHRDQETQVYYRNLLPAFLLLGVAAFGATGTIALGGSTDGGTWYAFCYVFCLWMFMVSARLVLVSPYKITVGVCGITQSSLLGTRRYEWREVKDIRWKWVRAGYDPTEKNLLLSTTLGTEVICEGGFRAGDPSMLEAILRFWRPDPGMAAPTLDRQAPARRLIRLTIVIALLLAAIVLGAHLCSLLGATWSPALLLLYCAAVGGWPLPFMWRLAKRGELAPVEGYSSWSEYETREVPGFAPAAQNSGARLFKRLFPTKPEDRLTPEEVRSVQSAMERLQSEINFRIGVVLTCFVLVGAYLPYLLNRRVQGAFSEGTILSNANRAVLFWGVAAFFGGIPLIGSAVARYHRRRDPEGMDLLRRYSSTVRGYDEKRAWRLACWIGIFASAFGCLSAWNWGEDIGPAGIRFNHSFSSYYHPYSEVRQIGVFERIDAPVGIRRCRSVRVTFDSGPALMLSEDSWRPIRDEAEKIASYISERSGVPVVHGDICPE